MLMALMQCMLVVACISFSRLMVKKMIRQTVWIVTAVLLSACELVDGPAEQGAQRAVKHAQSAIENYDEARPVLWHSLYRNGGNTLYCNQRFSAGQRQGLNIEHVFPMSWATNGLNCGSRKQCRARSAQFNMIEADLHNLYPSRVDVNKARSSYRFGDVAGEKRAFGARCDFEVNDRARVAEPAPRVRGEVARAMFYMAYRYKEQGLVLFKKQALLLHQWHIADLPSAAERQRNDRIEKLQGNRNLFIDDPDELSRLVNNGYFF